MSLQAPKKLQKFQRALHALGKESPGVLLQNHSALGELIDYALYDLSNTYWEGIAQGNANAALGKSKEKRTDCPLVTLALVLDASGFPKRSEIFAGNVSEPKTLERMVGALASGHTDTAPTVMLDAGIASEGNIAWLVEHGDRFLVVGRKRHRQFDPDAAVLIKEGDELTIRAQRRVDADTGEVELHRHSFQLAFVTPLTASEYNFGDPRATIFHSATQYLNSGLAGTYGAYSTV